MCLAQGPQCSDPGGARTRGPSVWSQALYHCATALPIWTVAREDFSIDIIFPISIFAKFVMNCVSLGSWACRNTPVYVYELISGYRLSVYSQSDRTLATMIQVEQLSIYRTKQKQKSHVLARNAIHKMWI